MAAKGAKVHVLDVNEPADSEHQEKTNLIMHHCNVTNWTNLRTKFEEIGHVDFAFSNAGISEEVNTFTDSWDAEGHLEEPSYDVLAVNLRGALNFIKLAWSTMKRNRTAGSIVITTSATAYAPEQSLPVYAGGKLAVS